MEIKSFLLETFKVTTPSPTSFLATWACFKEVTLSLIWLWALKETSKDITSLLTLSSEIWESSSDLMTLVKDLMLLIRALVLLKRELASPMTWDSETFKVATPCPTWSWDLKETFKVATPCPTWSWDLKETFKEATPCPTWSWDLKETFKEATPYPTWSWDLKVTSKVVMLPQTSFSEIWESSNT
jgi:hypothetical protein